jgi:hypothetical protein
VHMSRISLFSGARAPRAAVAALLLCTACDDSRLPLDPVNEPVEEIVDEIGGEAAEETLTAADTTTDLEIFETGAAVTVERRSSRPGLVFGSWGLSNEHLDQVHTGWMAGGAISPKNIISHLKGARARGGRVVIKLSRGSDRHVKNRDGSFSLSKWKALVSRYRHLNLEPFIKDGTIIGHYLIDEPHRTARWGRNGISRKTLEEMARYSKQLWPNMHTLVRVAPTWLAGAPFRWKHLDAGWAQYRASHGDPRRWITSETRAAEREGLGLMVGLNVLDGGNGSSRIRGNSRRKWAMSASEIRKYGAALLGSRRACGFFNWTHDSKYYKRSDIRSAMADVSKRARSHERTSCRQ